MKEIQERFDYLNRRTLMQSAASAFLGVTFLPNVEGTAAEKTTQVISGGGKATRMISLFMNGAMSQLDSFDLKPGSKVQGDTKPISTRVSGVQMSERLPGLAQHAEKMAIVNSMFTETAAHEQGRYLMRTSYQPLGTIRHPAMGAWILDMLGGGAERLPNNVVINVEAQYPGAGYMDSAFSPVPIGNPNAGLQNIKSPKYLTDRNFDKRLQLINSFDKKFQEKYPQKQVLAYNKFYEQAAEFMTSEDVKTFDLNQESPETRDKYGRNSFGQGCLLARRLAEKEVRFVEVALGGWDNHTNIYDQNQGIPQKLANLDQGMSSLLEELTARGLLEETLVTLTTEFGRTPKINENQGRDHHPGVFSCVMAGGGIKGGQVYGKSDEEAHSPVENAVSVQEFNATAAQALGISLTEETFSPSGRPFTVADHAEAVAALF